MAQAKEGQRVQLADGSIAVVKGGKLVPVAPPGAPVPRKFSPQEQIVLNKANASAQEGKSVLRDYDEASSAVKKLGTGPFWGSFLDAAIPVEDGGILDSIGGALIGAPARAFGAIDQNDIDNYTTLRRVQARRVLAEQKSQTGTQTEGDAARIKAGDIGIRSSEKTNAGAIARGRLESQILIDRANFMTQWANKYGVNGVNERGQPANMVFESLANQRRAALPQANGAPKAGTPTIRRIK